MANKERLKVGPVNAIPAGQYARRQLGCQSRIISWSHGARFRRAVRLAGTGAGRKLLDYGCGDGTFLGLVADRFAECWGADIAGDQLEDCRQRFRPLPNLRFCDVSELGGDEHTHAYAVVTCMETLEHCTEPVIDRVLADLSRLCSPAGKVVISVPVEIGPSFLLKYAVRTVAGWRRLSDYRHYESYTLGNAARMLFATQSTVVPRPVYRNGSGEFHSHYGFNWRRLRRRVAEALLIEQVQFSPLGFLGGWVSSQAWFVCRPRHQADEGRRPIG
jgi:2-polyprenyl-3-methyl-5-hydroxy-6-metoxy-1,4-benzoquinol methylase